MTMTTPTKPVLRAAASGIAATVLLIAGCAKDGTAGAAGPELPSRTSAPSPTTTTTPAGPKLNERGLIPKSIGEEAGFGAETETSVSFSIDAITVDPPCHEYGTKPDAGHTLLLDMRVATGSDAEAATYMSGLLNPFSFFEVGSDGVTRPAQSGTCTDYTKNLPHQFGINQKYSGTVELIVPEASGVLALQDVLENGGGWEWSY